MSVRPSAFAFALMLLFLTSAHAIPITVSFQVTGFGAGAPADPIAGSFLYEAASTTSNIISLTSVNLTIAGHTYTLGDVGFISPFGANQLIGGLANGVPSVTQFTDDFALRWDESSLVPFDFFYATANSNVFDAFGASHFTQFSVTRATVPEPTSWALLLAGAVCLGVARRWRSPFSQRASLS